MPRHITAPHLQMLTGYTEGRSPCSQSQTSSLCWACVRASGRPRQRMQQKLQRQRRQQRRCSLAVWPATATGRQQTLQQMWQPKQQDRQRATNIGIEQQGWVSCVIVVQAMSRHQHNTSRQVPADRLHGVTLESHPNLIESHPHFPKWQPAQMMLQHQPGFICTHPEWPAGEHSL